MATTKKASKSKAPKASAFDLKALKWAPKTRLQSELEEYVMDQYKNDDGTLFQTVFLLNSIDGQIEVIEAKEAIDPMEEGESHFYAFAIFHPVNASRDGYQEGEHYAFAYGKSMYKLAGYLLSEEAKVNKAAYEELTGAAKAEAKEAKAKAKAEAKAEAKEAKAKAKAEAKARDEAKAEAKARDEAKAEAEAKDEAKAEAEAKAKAKKEEPKAKASNGPKAKAKR